MAEKPSLSERVVSWVLGALFVFAGGLKLLDPAKFAVDIANYQLVSWPFAVVAASYLPWLEIFAGLGLIIGWQRSGALRVLIFLMVVFVQALFTAWVRGLNIECGCFGKALATSNYALLFLRDGAILLGLFWLLYREWKTRLTSESEDVPVP